MKLLNRDDFRNTVFARDMYKCVICSQPAQDVHHIIDRSIWPDGGYYVDNGVSLCGQHHIEAEKGFIFCCDLRKAGKIKNIIVPPGLEEDIDKWGKRSIPKRIKYPRTYHLPWSKGSTSDDKFLKNANCFADKEVVVTIKMDGENSSLYTDYFHARSLSGNEHPSQSWLKKFHATIAHEIPPGWRFCGENMYAKHAIHYKHLDSYFYLFSIWNDQNICLSWDETVEYAKILDIPTVPEVYRGIWVEESIQKLYTTHFNEDDCEGLVVRTTDEIPYKKFSKSVAKYVRKGHVPGSAVHWRTAKIIPNILK